MGDARDPSRPESRAGSMLVLALPRGRILDEVRPLRGKVIVDKCSECRGQGRVSIPRALTVKIPPGIHDGQAVRVSSEGEPPAQEISPAGKGIRGDLHVIVRISDHASFERDGDHLLIALPVVFTQLALGAKVPVPTIDGSSAVLTLPTATPPSTSQIEAS